MRRQIAQLEAEEEITVNALVEFPQSFEANTRPQNTPKGRECAFGIRKGVVIVVVLGVALHADVLNTDHRRYLRCSQVPRGCED